ncbi:hypothethical protein (plasmid) [Ralstonia solanacearum PSI07]|nr:hypothethical protein [Ralstonia solanacearum PSI07]
MTSMLEAAQALQALMHGQRQNKRLLRLSFPHDDAPAGALMVANRLEAYEGLSRDFQFTVEILSDNPDIALKDRWRRTDGLAGQEWRHRMRLDVVLCQAQAQMRMTAASSVLPGERRSRHSMRNIEF